MAVMDACRQSSGQEAPDDLNDLLLAALNVAENNLPKGHAQQRLVNLLERARALTAPARSPMPDPSSREAAPLAPASGPAEGVAGTSSQIFRETTPSAPESGRKATCPRCDLDAPNVCLCRTACGHADCAGREPTPPNDRGCVFCQAQPGEWCVADCGGPAPVIHPDNVWAEGDDD